MNRTDRLYAIAEELRRVGSRGTTSTRLAGQFEVTARTVKRDVSALQQAGLPVAAQAGPGGGYVLVGATLPPVALTPAQAVALALAVDALPPGSPFGLDARTARDKVLDALTPADRVRAAEISARVWTRPDEPPAAARRPDPSGPRLDPSTASWPDPPSGPRLDLSTASWPDPPSGPRLDLSTASWPDPPSGPRPDPSSGAQPDPWTGPRPDPATAPRPDPSGGPRAGTPVAAPAVLRAVEDALARHRVLALEYVDGRGVTSHRRVETVVLARTTGRWYLIAWCRDRADMRWFRLDRVRRADVTAEQYEPRAVADVGAPPQDARPLGGTAP